MEAYELTLFITVPGLSILTFLLQLTTLWWYVQWPTGVSSLFSVSASAIYNHYLKLLLAFQFFSFLREERLHGWGGRLWERNTGNEWDIHRRRALKTQRMNEDGICWKMNKRSLSLEFEYIMQLRLCMWNGVHSLLQNVQTSRLSHLNSK